MAVTFKPLDEAKVDMIFNVANPVAIAVTYALLQAILTDKELLSLAMRVLACAFFCNISFVSYALRRALGRKLRAVATPSTPVFAAVSTSPRLTLQSLAEFVDEHVIPFIVAWLGGYMLSYFLLHETSLAVFTAGFIYFIVSRLVIRELLKYLGGLIGPERVEKPRWIFVLGVLTGLIMTVLTLPVVYVLALVLTSVIPAGPT